jgi:hypothetical protein
MPKKNRNKSEKKKSKKRLSTEDILKIIKKLKPKNQQIVKVNIGDKAEKKKGSDVQSSYNPPFVFSPQGYSAITSPGQPPQQPPLIEAPRQAATWSSQPIKEPSILMPPPLRRAISAEPFISPSPATSIYPRVTYFSESEVEVSDIEPTSKQGKGYTVRAPRSTRSKTKAEAEYQSAEIIPELQFNAPKGWIPSNLSSSATAPIHFSSFVQNDKYQPDIIQTDIMGDQIGTISNSLPSDLWTGTPQGEITLSPEEIAAVSTSEAVADPFQLDILPAIQEEEIVIPIKKKREKLKAPETLTEVTPVQTPATEKSYTQTVKASLEVISIINKAIEKGFTSKNITPDIAYKIGASKGFIKKDAKSYLVAPVYEEVLAFNQKN